MTISNYADEDIREIIQMYEQSDSDVTDLLHELLAYRKHLENIPEGCTPADAKVLRKANHELADRIAELEKTVEQLKGEEREKLLDELLSEPKE